MILWPGVIGSFASTYIMWKSHQHDDEFGPFSKGYGDTSTEKDEETPSSSNVLEDTSGREDGVTSPGPHVGT